jgi:integrase/recombinase XerD
LIAVLIYTAARAGAVARLRLRDFIHDGSQFALRFAEKGGKARSIPVRHGLQGFIQDYLLVAGIEGDAKDGPLFRTLGGKRLPSRPMSGVDIGRMVKRRLKAAGLPSAISPHSFRSWAATALLLQGVAWRMFNICSATPMPAPRSFTIDSRNKPRGISSSAFQYRMPACFSHARQRPIY